jgi:hypothetical protein
MSRYPLLASLAGALACLGASAGCVALGTPDGNAVTEIVGPPSGAAFKPVGQYVVHRCGSLDCHGEVGRNLRLYGEYGLRLDTDAGMSGGGLTTADELDADYQSIVALEPELMNAVVAQGGAEPLPETLTFIRKPTAIENHKGGQLITNASDPQYLCLTSWLQSHVDTASCAAAIKTW